MPHLTIFGRHVAYESTLRQPNSEEEEQMFSWNQNRTENLPTHIIIDCSMFSYIDTSGVGQLKATVQEYESIGIKTFLAGLATHVDKMLEKDNFYNEVPPHHVYITIHDAVHHAQEDQDLDLDRTAIARGLESELESDARLSPVSMNSSQSDSCSSTSSGDGLHLTSNQKKARMAKGGQSEVIAIEELIPMVVP